MNFRRPKGYNGTEQPHFDVPDHDVGYFVSKFYQIEPVQITVVFDDPDCPLVELAEPDSSRLFELLSKANLNRGTVVHLALKGKGGERWRPIKPEALARLNWFLHMPGYTKGFRGWRISLEKQEAGIILWKSGESWNLLKKIIKI